MNPTKSSAELQHATNIARIIAEGFLQFLKDPPAPTPEGLAEASEDLRNAAARLHKLAAKATRRAA